MSDDLVEIRILKRIAIVGVSVSAGIWAVMFFLILSTPNVGVETLFYGTLLILTVIPSFFARSAIEGVGQQSAFIRNVFFFFVWLYFLFIFSFATLFVVKVKLLTPLSGTPGGFAFNTAVFVALFFVLLENAGKSTIAFAKALRKERILR